MVTHLPHDPRLPKTPRKAKYGNKITMIGDLRFHSLGEANRWRGLVLLERAKTICDLQRQVRLPLMVVGKDMVGFAEIGAYVADFFYVDLAGPEARRVIEDFKGFDTALSKWKRKHVAAQYGIEVRITGKRR